jgi:hypothetical protein
MAAPSEKSGCDQPDRQAPFAAAGLVSGGKSLTKSGFIPSAWVLQLPENVVQDWPLRFPKKNVGPKAPIVFKVLLALWERVAR